jgi:LPXTG-site transpeptidase (sortase) family protein
MTSRPVRNKINAIFPCLVLAALLVAACQPVTRGDAGAANIPAAEAAAATTLTVQPTLTAAPTSPTLMPEASPVAVALQQAPALSATETATSAPAAATTAGSGVRFKAGDVINVRGGPGTSYAILGKLAVGDGYAVSATNSARDWLQFTYQGQDGWVSAGTVQIQGDINSLAVLKGIPAPPPDRVVAPTIKLDSKVIPIGWHTEQTAGGPVEVWDVASYAAGWQINSAKPGQVGNMVLSGHHNILGEVFRYVVNLKVGDPIIIYAGGTAYNYRVTDNFILPDKYVSAQQRIKNGKWIGEFPDERLTLVTCWPYTNNTHRVIVIAKPVK